MHKSVVIAVGVLCFPFCIFFAPSVLASVFLVHLFWLVWTSAALMVWISIGYRVVEYLLSGILITDRYIKIIHHRPLGKVRASVIAKDHVVDITIMHTTFGERLIKTSTLVITVVGHSKPYIITQVPNAAMVSELMLKS